MSEKLNTKFQEYFNKIYDYTILDNTPVEIRHSFYNRNLISTIDGVYFIEEYILIHNIETIEDLLNVLEDNSKYDRNNINQFHIDFITEMYKTNELMSYI